MNGRLARMEKDVRGSAEELRRLEAKEPWITGEVPLFGQPGTDYDWAANNPAAARAELHAAQQSLSKLAKCNKDVRAMAF